MRSEVGLMNILLMITRIILIALMLAYPLTAGTTGKLVGQVLDKSTGEALAGVNIMIEATVLGAASDVDGYYLILGILPGKYTVIASYISYRDLRIEGVEINVDKTTRVDFKLEPATLELNEEIVVLAERPLIKKDLTSSESTLGRETIVSMPAENLIALVNLQAGVVNGHFRGGRSNEVMYMINGIPMNDVYSGSAAFDIDNNAIQELNVISGTFNAEYGQAMSGVVNVVTREGGQKVEGNISAYGGSYMTGNNNIFWNDGWSPQYNIQGTLSGPLALISRKLSFFLSGRYTRSSGYIFGKKVFLPTDQTSDFLLKDKPEDRQFMSLGQIYTFSEELASQLIRDAEKTSMNNYERFSTTFKLTWRLTPVDKINIETIYQDNLWREYEHEFRLNPDGAYRYKQWAITNSLSWHRVFSARTFMDMHYAYFYNTFKQAVYDDPFDERYVVKHRLQDAGANAFNSGGQQMWHFNRSTNTHLIKADLTSQINFNHQIKLGVEGKRHRLWMHEFEVVPELQSRIAPLSSFLNNTYRRYPLEMAGYFQDKMEYEDLVINAGLRLDYFRPDGGIPTDFENPDSSEQKDAQSSFQLSPRVGLAYPISEKGVVHVSYGHFFQTPNLYYLFTNPEFDIDPLQSSVSPPPQSVRNTVGNADLKPQRTTIYELGIQQQIGDIYGLSLTVYFKDIRNLLGTEVLRTKEGIRYGRYINRDYGFVRGLTINLERRFASGFEANINYTYQVAQGNASDPNNAFLDAEANKETVKQVVPLDWDRRHQINAFLRLGDPRQLMVSIIGRYGTGMPYTQASRIVQPLVENGGRKPDEYQVDLYLTKKLKLMKQEIGFFLRVYNLFDRLNERHVYSDTGRATYSTEPLYFGGVRPRGLNTLQDYYIRPNFYSEPRLVQLGLEVGF